MVVTVATRNYFHRVRSLLASVKELMPGALRLACSVDAVEGFLDAEKEGYELVDAGELGIPRFEQLMLALNPTAACCLLKPHAVMKAFQYPGIKRVLYIDNDMGLYHQPEEMLEALCRHSFVLTPHHLAPLPEGTTPDEFMQVSHGIYNAGMFGVANVPEAINFLKWWAKWMMDPRHLFHRYSYDQVWLNYVPVYCLNANVLREPGYNVAYWNLCERELTQAGGSFFCGAHPLVAFHFSAFDDHKPDHLISDNLSSILDGDISETEATRMLGTAIAASWKQHGRDQCLEWDYHYRSWGDGVVVYESEREYVSSKWHQIPPDLDLWSPTLQKDEPVIFARIRREWLAERKDSRVLVRILVKGLLDLSPRMLIRYMKNFFIRK
jgi:hypothetical protein